ncbi:MAG: methyltransferase domain-containing protein [Actinomycetota bacterium]|nr:methyltransferase domain-containing protein [Actinomycetota bacterium]
MAHKFDPKKMHKLDSAERRRLPPKETLLKLGLREGDAVADIGAGIGFFSFAAAEIVGKAGHVAAFDISPEMIDELKVRIEKAKTQNVSAILSKEYSFPAEKGTFDFALMANVLHEAQDRALFLKEAAALLKAGGKLAIIEWKKNTLTALVGPPLGERLTEAEVLALLIELNFADISAIDLSSNHFALTAVKSH